MELLYGLARVGATNLLASIVGITNGAESIEISDVILGKLFVLTSIKVDRVFLVFGTELSL